MKEKEVLIIIPAYNEAANIGKVLDQLEKPEISDIADILVMNDASVDATNWLVKVRGHALVTELRICILFAPHTYIQVGFHFHIQD